MRETERLELPGKCPETDVKENGSHIVTSSHITPHTQAPPTSTPPNIAPPPVTSSPSASPISSDTDQGSTHCLLPPAPPTPCQLLGNSQIESPDNVVGGDNREPDEGDTPVISDERARDPCVTVGESTLAEEVCVCVCVCKQCVSWCCAVYRSTAQQLMKWRVISPRLPPHSMVMAEERQRVRKITLMTVQSLQCRKQQQRRNSEPHSFSSLPSLPPPPACFPPALSPTEP